MRRWASSSWSNSTLEQARDLILMATPRFLGMANHLGQPERPVGGQGRLRGVTWLPGELGT